MIRWLRHSLVHRAPYYRNDSLVQTRRLKPSLALRQLEDRIAPATFTVTTDSDTGTGAGTSGDLRYCLTQANSNIDADTITFDAGYFNAGTPRTIKLISGPFNITTKVSLTGPGQSICTISGENATNVLAVSAPSATDPVSISGLTIARGRRITAGVQGTGISCAQADLTLSNLTITNCFNRDSGGGLAIQAGKLTGSFVTVTNNTVDSLVYGRGAGVYVSGTVAAQLNNCTISNNLASSNGSKFCLGSGLGDFTSGDVVLQNCTLTGNVNDEYGGAIYVSNNPSSGNTSLINCTVTRNVAGFAGGGLATLSTDAKINIQDCVFDGNVGVTSGGALSVVVGNPTITITTSEFTNNESPSGPGGVFATFNLAAPTLIISKSSFIGNTAEGSFGGAIYSQSGGIISLQIDDSTFANNSALSGGVIVISPLAAVGGSVVIRNSTLVGNKTMATGSGGALSLGGNFAGTVQLNNCTIAGNSAGTGGGGGLSVGTTQAACQVNIVNTIIAGNTAAGIANDAKADVSRENVAPAITVDFSLIGVVPASPPFTVPTPGSNKTGSLASPLDPMLRPIANYGGVTWTRPPLAASAAINAGTTASMPNDQRGTGFIRNFGGAVDIGAVEDNVALPWVSSVNVTNVTSNTAAQYEFTITFADTNAVDNTTLSAPGAIQIRGPGFTTPATATLKNPVAGPGTPLTATYVLTPAGGAWDAGDNGVYTVSVAGGTIFDTDVTKHSVVGDVYASFSVAIPITLVVDSTNDESTDTDGLISLREAVQTANRSLGQDTINFSPVVFSIDRVTTISLSAMYITDSVTINGPSSILTLDAGLASQHFSIGGSGQFIVSINNMTLVNGLRTESATGLNGGSIVVGNENCYVTNCTFKNNSAQAGGGAIAINASGNLTINNCVFDSNLVSKGNKRTGGAVFYSGSGNVSITNTSFFKNQSEAAGGALSLNGSPVVTIDKCSFDQNSTTNGAGGAIRSIAAGPGSLLITNSTLSKNVAAGVSGRGGAIALDGASTPMNVLNSTFSGNTANGAGGGLWLNNLSAPVKIQNSTMSLNASNDPSLGGGGISVTYLQAGGSVTISSTIVAQNTAQAGLPRDIAADAPFTIAGDNDLIGVADIGNFALSGSGHKTGTNASPLDAKLGALANNGGPTLTHGLQAGSPAIDTGNNAAGLATDQRGLARLNGAKTDIGAVESYPLQVASILVNGGAAQRSLVTSLKVTFNESVTFPSGVDAAFIVTRYDKGTTGSVALNIVHSGSDVTITFKSGGAIGVDPGLSLQDGKYELKIIAENVQGVGGFLDGNKNGIHDTAPADNFISNFHRLFGDGNGDGAVNSEDFAMFRLFFGLGASIFDFTGDGQTNSDDFAAFRARFGLGGYLP